MDGLSMPPNTASFTPRPEAVPAALARTVALYGPRPALDFLGRRWDWAEVGGVTARAAAGLQRLGVGRGTRVGICLPNTPYSIILYYAVLQAGGTVVNFNPLYTAREIETQARLAKIRFIATLDVRAIQDKITPLLTQGVVEGMVVCSLAAALPWSKRFAYRLLKRGDCAPKPAGAVTFADLTAPGAPLIPPVIDPTRDIAVLQFTGGTTGTPKAAALTHANIAANVAQILATGLRLDAGAERMLGALPLFHVFAMTVVMNLSVALGAEILLLPRPEVRAVIKLIGQRRPTMVPGVPTLLAAIAHSAETGSLKALGFVHYCIAGGAPTPAELASRFQSVTGCTIFEGYGLSEASPVVSLNVPGANRPGSIGRALPGTVVTIRDPEQPERLLPPGERGEICVAGPQVMAGYDDRPEETASAFMDGALRTGDIGYLDEDRYLFIVDRIKDLIICSGYNIYPRTIEEAAYRHPAVCEAIAIGVPDAYRGQAPKLFVTLRPATSATPEELKRFLADHLSKIELPREVEIRKSLPKTMIGKLSKKELLAELTAPA